MTKKEEGKQKLPRELQEYKKKLKELNFTEKVKEYFDCAPFVRDIDSKKKEVIYNSFTKKEKELFLSKFQPIYSSIDRYGDRVRAINGNCFIYASYVDTTLRQKDAFCYIADLLNRARTIAGEVMEGTKEESTKKKIGELLRGLSSFIYSNVYSPKIIETAGGNFGVNFIEINNDLLGVIQTLKGLLSLIKCYLESLKEFLEWVGTPELYPKEFENLERGFINKYNPITIKEKEDKYFPNFFTITEAEKEYLSIDYKELPLTVDIFGENNLWTDHYKSLFNFKYY